MKNGFLKQVRGVKLDPGTASLSAKKAGGLVYLQQGYTGNTSLIRIPQEQGCGIQDFFQLNSESVPGDIYHMASHTPFAN